MSPVCLSCSRPCGTARPSTGIVNHATRVTFNNTNGQFFFPATHSAGNGADAAILGGRLRLKANYDISRFSRIDQTILAAWKHYGLIIADNGSNNYVTFDNDPRWQEADLRALSALTEADFEWVDTGAPLKRVPR